MQSDLKAYRIATRALASDEYIVENQDWIVIAKNGNTASRFLCATLEYEVDIVSLILIPASVMIATSESRYTPTEDIQ